MNEPEDENIEELDENTFVGIGCAVFLAGVICFIITVVVARLLEVI